MRNWEKIYREQFEQLERRSWNQLQEISELRADNAVLKARLEDNRKNDPIQAAVYHVEKEGWRLRMEGPKETLVDLLAILERTPFRIKNYFNAAREGDSVAILIPRKRLPSEKKKRSQK